MGVQQKIFLQTIEATIMKIVLKDSKQIYAMNFFIVASWFKKPP